MQEVLARPNLTIRRRKIACLQSNKLIFGYHTVFLCSVTLVLPGDVSIMIGHWAWVQNWQQSAKIIQDIKQIQVEQDVIR